MESIKKIESRIDSIIEELNEPVYRAEILTAKSKLIELKKALNIHNVATHNWFEKLPLHWKLAYHLIGGIVIGYLLHYVW